MESLFAMVSGSFLWWRFPFDNPVWTLRIGMLILVLLLLLGAVVVSLAKRWRKASKPLGPTPDEELSQFREMYERGELTREEFHRLKEVLGGRIRARLGKVVHPELKEPNPPTPDGSGSTDIRPG